MEQQGIITQNYLCSGKPTQKASAGVQALDISAGTLYRQITLPSGNTYVVWAKNYFQPAQSGSIPSGPAGGDLTGTYPNPSINPDKVVPSTRRVDTTSPLTGGGALSANLTLSIPKADASTNGYLSSSDWTAFNSKATATKGSFTLDFGDSDTTTTTVVAQTSVLSTSRFYFQPADNQEYFSLENITITVLSQTAGAGFTVMAYAPMGTHGTYTINYVML